MFPIPAHREQRLQVEARRAPALAALRARSFAPAARSFAPGASNQELRAAPITLPAPACNPSP